MIARYHILLPFDLFITDHDEWTTVEATASNLPQYRMKVYPPTLYSERPKPTDSVLTRLNWTARAPTFSENVLVGDRQMAQVNVLTVDFLKDDFDRSIDAAPDPSPELAFAIANEFLLRIRVYSRAFQIKPLWVNRDPWRLKYLADDLTELESEDGKRREKGAYSGNVGVAAITPEILQLVSSNWNGHEPYVWAITNLTDHCF